MCWTCLHAQFGDAAATLRKLCECRSDLDYGLPQKWSPEGEKQFFILGASDFERRDDRHTIKAIDPSTGVYLDTVEGSAQPTRWDFE